jgi:hypothetical protein
LWVDSDLISANLLVVSELTWSSAVSVFTNNSYYTDCPVPVKPDFVKKMFESKSFAYYKIVHD